MAEIPARRSEWTQRGMAVGAAVCLIAAGAPLVPAAAAAAPAPAAPAQAVKLITAQQNIRVPVFNGRLFLDPGIYVVATGSRLQLNVQRASYKRPLTINRVIQRPGGGTRLARWPHSTLDGLKGLRSFLHLTIKNSAGKTVASRLLNFCPNDFNPQRATASSKRTSPFPTTGCASDPFQTGMVWGIQQGWGSDPAESGGGTFRLPVGTYQVQETITAAFRKLLDVHGAAATTTVTVHAVKGHQCCADTRPRPVTRTLPLLPAARTLSHPPASVLPDLVPLPSWNIDVQHQRKQGNQAASDQLMFGATVWMGGNARLDVEGFRSHGSRVMKAYQYFWRNGHVIGRARAGTMSFVKGSDDDDWHFAQFAQYRLLNAAKTNVLRSHKEGFCIAPTDLVNAFLPGAPWQINFDSFFSGGCGQQTALSVQEAMPVGWGDTYFQDRPGEDFNITNLPNGTYYIEIVANPEKVLHETKLSNDVSLRKVILGGVKGHRTVKVPAFHGLDPEH
jgi:hypothetical protein